MLCHGAMCSDFLKCVAVSVLVALRDEILTSCFEEVLVLLQSRNIVCVLRDVIDLALHLYRLWDTGNDLDASNSAAACHGERISLDTFRPPKKASSWGMRHTMRSYFAPS